MIFQEGDKVIMNDIECQVALVTVYGQAFISPTSDGHEYQGKKIYMGVTFTVIDHHGKDKYGNKAKINMNSGAV